MVPSGSLESPRCIGACRPALRFVVHRWVRGQPDPCCHGHEGPQGHQGHHCRMPPSRRVGGTPGGARWRSVGCNSQNQNDCREYRVLLLCSHILSVFAQSVLEAIGNHAHATTRMHIAHTGRPAVLRPNLKATVVANVAQQRALPISAACAFQVR